ncbi:MAG: hypothetical protein OXI91_01975, partial [Chloroflexota bacterium]|nr:hypothetical protein [Chloroflexota bacterium]
TSFVSLANPARLTVNTGQAVQGILDTGIRRYDGAGWPGNSTNSELLLNCGSVALQVFHSR